VGLLLRVISVRTRGFGGRGTGGGQGQCRVAAAYVSARSMLAVFFITISQVIYVRTRVGFGARG
jgi:hypothetical protein